jgi:hypothetical protein
MKRWTIVILALATGVFGQTRPREPWVFRAAIKESTFPSQQGDRLVAVLLASGFTALYSTVKGGLYMTRSGTAQDGNVTYGHRQDGNVLGFTGGEVLHRNYPSGGLWELMNAGTPVSSQNVFKGYTLTDNAVTMRYVVTGGTATVKISETPEFVAGGNGGIRRTLKVEGLPSGQTLRLRLSGQVGGTESWAAQSGGTLSGSNPQYLTISADGTAVLTGTW